jgi:hypothetical protein
MWEGSLLQLSRLCFGFLSYPWTITKILKLVVALLRKRGIRIVVYLDDFLILNQAKEETERYFVHVVEIQEHLVFD